MKTAYLDNQASTPLDPRVRAVLVEALGAPGNASAEEHSFGWQASRRLAEARGVVADFIGAAPEEVAFTSGATEANNLAILGAAAAAPAHRRRILVSAIEHKSVLEAAYATRELGFAVEAIPVSASGVVDVTELMERLDGSVAVVSIMAVNNEVGTIQPIEQIGSAVKSSGAFLHVDATQAPVARAIDVGGWSVDALSLSGHKMYAPQGIGVLYVSEAAPWSPSARVHGGGQERGLRSGTVPVALCAALGEACRILKAEGADEREHVGRLKARLLRGLRGVFSDLVVTSAEAPRHPGCLHVRLPGVSASDLLMRVQPSVAAATGSACNSGVMGASHVVLAMGLTPEQAGECLRFSVGRFTTKEEIDYAVEVIGSAALRAAA